MSQDPPIETADESPVNPDLQPNPVPEPQGWPVGAVVPGLVIHRIPPENIVAYLGAHGWVMTDPGSFTPGVGGTMPIYAKEGAGEVPFDVAQPADRHTGMHFESFVLPKLARARGLSPMAVLTEIAGDVDIPIVAADTGEVVGYLCRHCRNVKSDAPPNFAGWEPNATLRAMQIASYQAHGPTCCRCHTCQKIEVGCFDRCVDCKATAESAAVSALPPGKCSTEREIVDNFLTSCLGLFAVTEKRPLTILRNWSGEGFVALAMDVGDIPEELHGDGVDPSGWFEQHPTPPFGYGATPGEALDALMVIARATWPTAKGSPTQPANHATTQIVITVGRVDESPASEEDLQWAIECASRGGLGTANRGLDGGGLWWECSTRPGGAEVQRG